MVVSPKQRISSLRVKRGRPPKCKLFTKKLSGLEKMTVDQSVFHEKEKAQCRKWKRATFDNAELKSAVMERALEVQANLSSEFPSLIKYMLPSHVTGGFWLGLPKPFCSMHLPKEDSMMVLEDEEGKEFQVKYLVQKIGLSGGWRGFSIAHKLLEGEVYIVRGKGSDEVDVALGLLKLESSTQQIDLGKEPEICENRISEEKTVKFLDEVRLDISKKGIQENDPTVDSSNLGLTEYQSENDRVDLGSEVLDQIRLAEYIVDFKEVKNFEDFNILVNGLIIDSELSKYLQMKYYELCSNQKSFLHENLLGGLNCKLVAGVIAETINIADAIKASKVTTSHHSFRTWDQTLKSFEGLGMNVGFLRARLDQLMNLSMKSRRYQEAKLKQANANAEKRKLEAKLVEVTETLNRLDIEIGSLEKENTDGLEMLFQEAANAPW